MIRVLVAGLPGTGKGIFSSILGSSPDLDVTFASWPNKGDFDPGAYDVVILTDRSAEQQLQSHRRKFSMAITEAEARQFRSRGLDQLAAIAADFEWPYRLTVEWDVNRIIAVWAERLSVAPWNYDGPDILDGDTTDENGMYPVVQTFRHNG